MNTGLNPAAEIPEKQLKYSRYAVLLALAILLASLNLILWTGPDFWYHLYLGRRVLETWSAQPPETTLLIQLEFVNFYWLFQVFMLGVFNLGHYVAVSLFFVGLWFAVFRLWWQIVKGQSAPTLACVLLLVNILVCQPRYEIRPEMVGYFFILVQILVLQGTLAGDLRRKWLLAYTAIEVVFANVHGYFIFGPLLAGAALVANVISGWLGGKQAPEILPRLFFFVIASSLAMLVSPFGIRNALGVIYLLDIFQSAHLIIQEFRPPVHEFLRLWTVEVFWGYWILTIGACFFAFHRKSDAIFALILAGAGLLLSAFALRNVPFLVLFGAPVWSFALVRLGELIKLSRTRRQWQIGANYIIASAALMITLWGINGNLYYVLASETSFGVGISKAAYPADFLDYLENHPFHGTILNSSSDGGFLEFFRPDLRIYGDSRFTNINLVKEYFSAVNHLDGFLELDQRYHFDGVLLRLVEDQQLVREMLQKSEWQPYYLDLHRAFFIHVRSPLASTLPPPAQRFYLGEDLTQRVHGLPAITWTNIFAEQGNRLLLLTALTQFNQAPAIPSFVIEFALKFALMHHDIEIARLAYGMRSRLYALEPADTRSVDDWLRQIPREILQ